MNASQKRRIASAICNLSNDLKDVDYYKTISIQSAAANTVLADVNGEKIAYRMSPATTTLYVETIAGSIESLERRLIGLAVGLLIVSDPARPEVIALAEMAEKGSIVASQIPEPLATQVKDLIVAKLQDAIVNHSTLKDSSRFPTFSRKEFESSTTALPPDASFNTWLSATEQEGTDGYKYVPCEAARGRYRLPRDPERPVLGSSEPIPESILVVPYTDVIARTIASSYQDPRGERLNNVLLYGPSAGGKSVGARVISALLDLPFYGFNIGPNTSEVSLFGGFVPKTKNDGDLYARRYAEEFREYAGSLSDFDIELSPEEPLKRLGAFHEGEPHAKQVERLKAIRGRVLREEDEKKETEPGAYTYALSSFLHCFAFGGVIDLAEGQLAQNQALLGVLNSALAEGYVSLPMSGQIVRRHPNCVIIATGNIGVGHYGAKQLTQSVYSRLTYKVEVPDMNAEELAIIAKQKFGEEEVAGTNLTKLATAFVKMREELKAVLLGDNSGGLDARTFFAWGQMSKTMGLKAAACCSVVPSASQVRDNQTKAAEVIVRIIEHLEDGTLAETI